VPLLAAIWWWTARRSARQAPGNAELRESTIPAEARYSEPDDEEVRAPPGPRDRGASPLEPLNIRTTGFEEIPVLDGPMMVNGPVPAAAPANAAKRVNPATSTGTNTATTGATNGATNGTPTGTSIGATYGTPIGTTTGTTPTGTAVGTTPGAATSIGGAPIAAATIAPARFAAAPAGAVSAAGGPVMPVPAIRTAQPPSAPVPGVSATPLSAAALDSMLTAPPMRAAQPLASPLPAVSAAAVPAMPAAPAVRAASSSVTPAPAPSLAPPPNSAERQKIITIRVCTLGEDRWPGAQLLAALELRGLAFGRYQVFHRNHADGRSLFCVASLVEPGTFNIAEMAGQEFRGVTLFAVLPGPIDPLATVDELLETARQLGEELSGVLQDGKGMLLSPQRAAAIREDVARFAATLPRN